jgi:hypothetical protein
MLHPNSRNILQSHLLVDEKPLLVHHVARICGIARRTVRWAAGRGLLKGFKDPRTPKIWRFWRYDVSAFLECRQAAEQYYKSGTRKVGSLGPLIQRSTHRNLARVKINRKQLGDFSPDSRGGAQRASAIRSCRK